MIKIQYSLVMHSTPIHILGISGSLKTSSANTRILHELAAFQNKNIRYTLFENLEDIPPFNPDKEEGNSSVKNFKHLLQTAQGVILSTPEYAFGLPGVLKNALDWTVSSGDLNEKPLIAVSASPLASGGSKAMDSLLLTLNALGTKTDAQSHLCIPDILNKMNADRHLIHEPTKLALEKLLDHLIETILEVRS